MSRILFKSQQALLCCEAGVDGRLCVREVCRSEPQLTGSFTTATLLIPSTIEGQRGLDGDAKDTEAS